MIETPVRPTGLDTEADALAALAELVEGREDYVYPAGEFGGCMNVDPENGCGRCLIGTLLLAHGVPAELFTLSLHPAEGHGGTANFSGINELTDRLIDLPEEVVSVLSAAQDAQDQGLPWGEALAAARDHAEWTGVPA
jgi:hypothetical protein